MENKINTSSGILRLQEILKICKTAGWILQDMDSFGDKIERMRFKLRGCNVILLITDKDFVIHSLDNTMIDLVDIAFIRKMTWFIKDYNAELED